MTAFDYEHINLIPKMCVVGSRSECDPRIRFGSRLFNLPIVPANMQCVINDEIAIKLAINGFFYINHRFDVDAPTFIQKMKALNLYSSISLGVNSEAYNVLQELINHYLIPDYITIDVAHGHSISMKNIITYIRQRFPTTFIIAGNVSTPEATKDLEAWGANAIKVGIGPGSACTTYNATGFGSRGAQAYVVKICADATELPATKIIADGGITYHGDIAKSLALGAHMVMIGGMFSSLTDSPGAVVNVDGQLFKEFWGSASSFQSNKKTRIEGTKKLLPLKPHSILDEMQSIKEGLQSAISYGGGSTLDCFQSVKYFIKHK